MSHQTLYRKYRSRNFDEVLGQEHLVKTLKNQILTDNIAHAYLLCGIRGTGKTSTARILARAVNCVNNTDGNPCNECEICKSILEETNMDVVEMDAASNNGVDDIRDLRDKANFMPSKSKYKVYIIDEVHMLSKGAFNALLKILEEPPAHLIFILATTEPQKIPATILSRCQRFDFRRFTIDDLVSHMQFICRDLQIEADEKALRLIACNSDGAMRDALSILDRCLTFNQDKINYSDVNDLLGIVSFESVIEVADSIINKDIRTAMTLINNILSQGKDLIFFIEELVTYFRNVLVYKTTSLTDNLIRITQDDIETVKRHASILSTEDTVLIIQKLSEALAECKRAVNPRIILETKIISMIEHSGKIGIDALLNRIEALENAIKNGMPVSSSNIENKNTSYANKNIVNKKPEEKLQKSQEVNKAPKSKAVDIGVAVENDEEAKNSIIQHWNELLKMIRSENAGLAAIIRESKLVAVTNRVINFEFDSKFTFHYSAANQEKNKLKIKEILSNFLKSEYNVIFTLKSDKAEASTEKSMEDVFEDMKNAFGDDKVELK